MSDTNLNPMTIKRATRTGVRPLIGLYSESGCGKTLSALLLARGLAGTDGKIVMIDSESGRGSLYADVVPGGYETIELGQPFSPTRYIEAIEAVEKSGAAIGIVDSGSHEWEGIGGVLEMASLNEERTGKPGLHCWRVPKMEHAKFLLRLLRSSIPWIVCLRAKYKSRQVKENGKTEIVKDDTTSPIQAEDFIFEMTLHAEILQDHTIIVTKSSHPELRKCFPENRKDPIGVKHGELLAKWCQSAGTSAEDRVFKKRLLELVRGKVQISAGNALSEADKAAVTRFLVDEMFIAPDESLATLAGARLGDVVAKLERKQN